MTRFMIADNFMVAGTSSAIIHTLNPQAIIEVIEGHKHYPAPYRHYQFNDELFTFRVHHLFTKGFDSERHHIITTKLLNRAWHWFTAYMEWEDEQDHEEN